MSDEDLDRQEAVPVPPRLGELQELVDEGIPQDEARERARVDLAEDDAEDRF